MRALSELDEILYISAHFSSYIRLFIYLLIMSVYIREEQGSSAFTPQQNELYRLNQCDALGVNQLLMLNYVI